MIANLSFFITELYHFYLHTSKEIREFDQMISDLLLLKNEIRFITISLL